MGRKGNWFSSVKKALSPESKEKKDKKSNKSKKKRFGQQNHQGSNFNPVESVTMPPPPPLHHPEEVNLSDVENEQSKHAYSVAVATAAAAEVAVAAAQAAAEVVRLTTVTQFDGKSKEEVAAIKIQTAFRGYLARRASSALRGLVRLKSLMEGSVVKRQATNTLRCMQTLARVQSQICSRRIRMSEENQALQRQLLQKHAKELENLRIGEEWDDSLRSKEQIEANLLGKYEAATRRERALAYAFTHQRARKNSSRSANPLFMDPSNPTWGWSWLERWMAGRPWESLSTEKELNNEHSSVKSASRSTVGGEISKAYARYQLNTDNNSPTASQKSSRATNFQSPSTPSKPASSTVTRKLKPVTPKGSIKGPDDDSKSMVSMHSDQYGRHSIAGSSVRDDDSLASSPSVRSYMVHTESARAKSKLQSPLGLEKNEILKPASSGSAKKRLSYPPSPARPRRHSGPPKVDISTKAELIVSNEGGS